VIVVRTLFSRVLAAVVLVLVPAIAAAAPVGPETIVAIPHYPNETCAKVRTDGAYEVQVCWTSDPIRTVEDWTRTALSADDGWHDDASGRERMRNGLLQSVDFGEPRIIKYFARDITS
jgi:hypothetical protein